MVCILHECHCGQCPGSSTPPKRADGQMVFGGVICRCDCHVLTGTKRKEFLRLKYPNGLPSTFSRDLSKLEPREIQLAKDYILELRKEADNTYNREQIASWNERHKLREKADIIEKLLREREQNA